MAKVELIEPAAYLFNTEIQIRITDLNYGNHLANDALVSILHEARMRLLSSLGYTEIDVEGVSLIQGNLVVVYKSEGYFADILSIEMNIQDIGNKSFDVFYKVFNQTQNRLLALAKTGMVGFNYQKSCTEAFPEKFKTRFS